MIKASEVSFGLEVEVQFPNDLRDGVAIGAYHVGTEQEWLPEGWTVQQDESLTADSGYFAAEVVSPKLTGEEGLQEVVWVLDLLKEMGCTTNRTMGMHVHVDGKDLTEADLTNLKKNFAVAEKFFFEANGQAAIIRYNSKYCKPSRLWNPNLDKTDRYRSLNLKNWYTNRGKRTVEFRLWASTVEAEMAVAAIYVGVGLVVNTKNLGRIRIQSDERADVLRALFRSREIDRIVDEECWDVLLHMAHKQKKSTFLYLTTI